MTTQVPGINWTGQWQRRSEARKAHARRSDSREPYNRDADPLFDLDLPEVWEQLTGEPVKGTLSRCPSPDHEDREGSCAVRARLFFCNGCDAKGSIIDLGALLYGIEPRGAGFFQIRSRLFADLGMDEARAA